MLEDIKTLIGVTTDKEDSKLNIYVRIAVALIKNYLKNPVFDDDYIKDNFSEAIILIVSNAYECKKTGNVKSETQGSRSKTYFDNTSFIIDDAVATLLPNQYIQLFY